VHSDAHGVELPRERRKFEERRANEEREQLMRSRQLKAVEQTGRLKTG
jgi:hypothetical protein